MADDNVISFPKRQPSTMRVQTMSTGDMFFRAHCSEVVHCFENVPGRCECGKEFWDGADIPDGIGVYKPPV